MNEALRSRLIKSTWNLISLLDRSFVINIHITAWQCLHMMQQQLFSLAFHCFFLSFSTSSAQCPVPTHWLFWLSQRFYLVLVLNKVVATGSDVGRWKGILTAAVVFVLFHQSSCICWSWSWTTHFHFKYAQSPCWVLELPVFHLDKVKLCYKVAWGLSFEIVATLASKNSASLTDLKRI